MASVAPKYAWMNGKVIPWEQCVLHGRSAGGFMGSNVFEGVRAYWNPQQGELFVFKHEEHLQRLGALDEDRAPGRALHAARDRAGGARPPAGERVPPGRPLRPGGLLRDGGPQLQHPRPHGRQRGLHHGGAVAAARGAVGRGDRLRGLVAAHQRRHGAAAAQGGRQLPEQPAGADRGQGGRLRHRDHPEPARHGGRGPRRLPHDGARREAGHAARHGRDPGVHHPHHADGPGGARAGRGGGGAGGRPHRAVRGGRGVHVRERPRGAPDHLGRPDRGRRRDAGFDDEAHPGRLLLRRSRRAGRLPSLAHPRVRRGARGGRGRTR